MQERKIDAYLTKVLQPLKTRTGSVEKIVVVHERKSEEKI